MLAAADLVGFMLNDLTVGLTHGQHAASGGGLFLLLRLPNT
jgi:hypothetical protein